jgi:hypothetical protein
MQRRRRVDGRDGGRQHVALLVESQPAVRVRSSSSSAGWLDRSDAAGLTLLLLLLDACARRIDFDAMREGREGGGGRLRPRHRAPLARRSAPSLHRRIRCTHACVSVRADEPSEPVGTSPGQQHKIGFYVVKRIGLQGAGEKRVVSVTRENFVAVSKFVDRGSVHMGADARSGMRTEGRRPEPCVCLRRDDAVCRHALCHHPHVRHARRPREVLRQGHEVRTAPHSHGANGSPCAAPCTPR